MVTVWVEEVAEMALRAERLEAREEVERVEEVDDHFGAAAWLAPGWTWTAGLESGFLTTVVLDLASLERC